MQIPISTKIERAWYVDPELWAADHGAQTDVEIAAHSSEQREATLTLGDADLEETKEEVRALEEGRHYEAVSLKGALLAADEEPAGGGMRRITDLVRSAALPARLEAAADGVVRFVEGSGRSPLKLAAISFSAGVGTTLLGVLLAL